MNASSRASRGAIVFVVLLVALSSVAGVATATSATPAQTGPGGAIVVDEGETSSGISTLSGSVLVRGTVNGDVNTVSGNVVVAEGGTVTGNVNGAAGSLRIAGRVGGNVDFAGGTVDIAKSATIGGNVNLGAGDVRLAGTVDGDVTVGADRIMVEPSAVIGRDLRYDGTLAMQEGATVRGSVIHDTSIGSGVGSVGWGTSVNIPSWFDTIYGFFANLLLGALLLVLFPRFSDDLAHVANDRPARSFGWGLVGLIGVPILIVALAITLIGIPVALLVAFLYALAIWVAVVYGEYAVGRVIVARLDTEGRWRALLAGLLAFALLGLIPVLGDLLVFAVMLVGLGALASALRGRFGGRDRDGNGPSPVDAPPDTGGNDGSQQGSTNATSTSSVGESA